MTTHTELAAPTFAEFVDEAEATMEMVKRTFGTRGAPPKVIEAFATITMVEQLLKQCEQIRAAALESTERLAGGGAKGVIIDAYAFPSATQFGNEIRVQRTRQIEGPALWKVVDGRGNCLNKSGEWEWEPMPSSRDAEFLSRCRFPTADAAIERAHGITPKEGT